MQTSLIAYGPDCRAIEICSEGSWSKDCRGYDRRRGAMPVTNACETLMRTEILNSADHGRLRIRASAAAIPHFVQIVLSEFRAAAACSPILLTKDATSGEFYAGALLGFKSGEALRRTLGQRGGFQPLNFVRDGFFISGEQVAIDRDNPRFSETEGEPLFDGDRQPTVHLRQVQRALRDLHDGLEKTRRFIQTLGALELIEPIDVSLRFDSGEQLTLQGLYTVSMDSLAATEEAEVLKLFRAGYLQLAYTMNVSLSQIAMLAHIRNSQLAQAPI
jgi:hypothetical protein